MTEESFVILEGNEIKIAFNKGAEILFEGIRGRSFDTFSEYSISDGLTLLYAEIVTAYEAEGKKSPYTMESFLLNLTSHEAQSAVMEAQKLAKRWKDRNKIEGTMKPFDKVLVRNAEHGLWIPALFGMEKDGQYITSAGWQKYCIPYEENENLIGTKNAAAKIFRSDWREKCCAQCKYKFVEYKGKQHQCDFSKCTDEEVAEFNEHHGCQGIREYLKTGVFPERGRK